MSITLWRRKRNPSPCRRAGVRPQLESLDGRLVPTTLHVTNLSSSSSVKGSLPYELAHASAAGKDTIDFRVGGQINLSSELLITKGVTIKGPGPGVLTLTTNYNWSDPWGDYFPRALEVNADKPVVISGITIADNRQSTPAGSMGSAVYNHSTLTMSNCDLTDNGADYGGAVYNAGTMTLVNCTLKNDRGGYGAAVYNAGTMTVTGCTLSFDYGDGYPDGGSVYNTGTLSIGGSTFVLGSPVVGPYTDLGGNQFITGLPVIGSFTATASTVTAGDSLTLTATSITDANPNSSITQVLIYGPNSIGGIPLGYATQTSPGVWTFTFTTTGWAPGTDTFYAVAVDSYGVSSLAANVTVQIV